jgi:dolichol kinase
MSRKVTTEQTNKSIKGFMALFALGFWGCLFYLPFSAENWTYFAGGAAICAFGYLLTKIARWWENE